MNDESQARALAKAQREARIRENEFRTVVQGIMSVRAGRQWVLRILTEWCSIASTPFTSDPAATAFNCGQQNIGLRLQADVIEAAPNDYLLMLKEQAYDRSKPANTDTSDDSADSDANSESDTDAEHG